MLEIKNLSYQYPQSPPLIKGLSFSVDSSKRTCILGESGSGKSTLLKLIYGLLQPAEGEIIFNGTKIKGPKYQLIPGYEEMKYVAQDFDLSLFMTVAENVGTHLSNIYMNKKRERIYEILQVLSLEEFSEKKPIDLSGGQMQRVAIARALAKMPKMLVLDEPFSHLDAALHINIRKKLIEYCEKKNMGLIFSSHRADDALGYSDNLIILRQGNLLQSGTPTSVYQNPKSVYIAELFGKINQLTPKEAVALQLTPPPTAKQCILYPQEIAITPEGFPAEVAHCRFIGRGYELDALCNNILLTLYHPKPITKGSKIRLALRQYRWTD